MQESLSVSVILPVYNAEKYINEAVQSVIDQYWKNWELLIVNDGSTDGTRIYLDSLADSRIKVIHQENRGVSAARNVALDLAKGEYITFLDADDVLPPMSLEARVSYLQTHPEVDIVDGVISVRNEVLEVELRSYMPYYNGPLLARLLKLDDKVFFGVPYMFRRSILGNNLFEEDMTHCEDLLFYLRMAAQSKSNYGYVDDVVYYCRVNSFSAMSNFKGLERGYFQFLDAVRSLQGISIFDRLLLRLKIAKILFLCWLSRAEIIKSLTAVIRSLMK